MLFTLIERIAHADGPRFALFVSLGGLSRPRCAFWRLMTDIGHIADIVLGSNFRGFGNRTRRAIPLTHWSIHICELTRI